MQGLYAPTAEDLEAMQSNRADAMQASSIAGILAHIPQMRKQKKATQYWRQRDAHFNAPITVAQGGMLTMTPEAMDGMSFGSMTDEWNKYKSYMDSKGVGVTEEDYLSFKPFYELKMEEYGKNILSKFNSMEMSGVSSSAIKDLVAGNPKLRDSMIQLGALNPDLQSVFSTYTQPRTGLVGGLQSAIPDALKTGAAFASLPLAAVGGYTGYQKLAGGKNTGLFKNLRSAFDISTGKRFKEKAVQSDLLRKKGDFTTTDKKVVGKKNAAVNRAQKVLDGLKTKAGKLKKGKTAADLSKAQTNLKKAQTILDKAKVPTKQMSKGAITSKLKSTLKKKGVRGVYQLLVKNVGKRAALGLMARVGLGTALSTTGIGTAVGLGLNAMAIAQIAKALAGALQEVEGDSTMSEKMFGKQTSSLEGATF